MTDTSPDVAKLYRKMLMGRPGAERFRMGLDMFAMASRIALATLRAESVGALRERVFIRLYGNEFAPDELDRIVAAIRESGRHSSPRASGSNASRNT